jgi:CDP-diacylglycerol--glycerol-3-phosphate 3-phosphatidyltransferase
MTAADKVTSIRIVLAPVFFVVYMLPVFNPPFSLSWTLFSAGGVEYFSKFQWTVPVLWLIFIVSEITDLIDGKLARGRNEVSDFGKFYDPFADTLVR